MTHTSRAQLNRVPLRRRVGRAAAASVLAGGSLLGLTAVTAVPAQAVEGWSVYGYYSTMSLCMEAGARGEANGAFEDWVCARHMRGAYSLSVI